MVKLTRNLSLTSFASSPPTAFTPEPVRRRVAGMKQILLMIAVVALVGGCASGPGHFLTKEESAKVIEAAIRKAAKKSTGELTDVNGLENLTQLTFLRLDGNQLTDVKALTKCQIVSDHGWFNYRHQRRPRHQGRSGGHSEEEEEE